MPVAARTAASDFVWQRLALLAIVVLGHVSVVLFLTGHSNDSREVQPEEISVLPIILILAKEPESEPAALPTLREAQPVRSQLPRLRDNGVIASPPPAMEPPLIATPAQAIDQVMEGARVDWIGLAEKGVQQWDQSTPRHREFGAIPEEETSSQEAPVNFFRKSREGEIQMIGPGLERRWVSDRCYMEFGHPPDLFFSLAPKVNMAHCLAPRGPRDDLFDHLKPEYLKQRE